MRFTLRKVLLFGAGILIILLLLIPKLKSLNHDNNNASSNATFGNAALPVSVHIIKPERLKNRILTTGTVLANEEVELKSEISGRITEIRLDEGSRVRGGQLLVKINDAELRAQLLKAQYQKKLAEDKERRGRKQLEIEAISQEDYDVILNELNTVKAEIQLIKAQIDKTEIRAPFDGVVGLRHVSKGSYISSDTKIANLLDINPVKIDFSIPERYVNLVEEGDRIVFKVQGYDEEFEGEVYALEPRIDPATRTLQLRAFYPNKENKILPGAFADVRLVLDEIENALMIPTEALVPELKGQKVFLLKNGQAMPRQVEIGLRTEKNIQITEGLAAGDTVITSGILQLRPGDQVTVSGSN
ncbi:efflux RND transporter periplasmic adaptor subunit [candidate division KSB1 bacterium]|nr:efflux RND transporter periplasmic adaptor subunit [candidate division KSB1 bacterium]NIR69810.1 efflux RND transporter periplasmic adaptor subunit [candidate division KSB1 bacterium]NIS25800.1 efflux RND transporter periplasmic adaptor subunit [candidate division KSB1 bacterium]NIT72674.1 efflux RND transporter periplasmic adaptor subunit [candidate division KSB1 bacterium]NIU26489.1 efflux RND transporter periplasmic adaptor subunit [candidate division KSB1 bacterium]